MALSRAARRAARLARVLVTGSADRVIVLYVREFSIARIGQMIADHGGAAGRERVDGVVAGLRASGGHATGLVREADIGMSPGPSPAPPASAAPASSSFAPASTHPASTAVARSRRSAAWRPAAVHRVGAGRIGDRPGG